MNHGNGIKDREDGSSGIEILIAEAFAKSSPTRKSEFFDVTHRELKTFKYSKVQIIL
jgi:hypothetical protein